MERTSQNEDEHSLSTRNACASHAKPGLVPIHLIPSVLGSAQETEGIPLTEYFPIFRVPEYSESRWRSGSVLGSVGVDLGILKQRLERPPAYRRHLTCRIWEHSGAFRFSARSRLQDLPRCRGTSWQGLLILTEGQNTSTAAANFEDGNIPS